MPYSLAVGASQLWDRPSNNPINEKSSSSGHPINEKSSNLLESDHPSYNRKLYYLAVSFNRKAENFVNKKFTVSDMRLLVHSWNVATSDPLFIESFGTWLFTNVPGLRDDLSAYSIIEGTSAFENHIEQLAHELTLFIRLMPTEGRFDQRVEHWAKLHVAKKLNHKRFRLVVNKFPQFIVKNIKDELNEEKSEEVRKAWEKLFEHLHDQLKKREDVIYEEQTSKNKKRKCCLCI